MANLQVEVRYRETYTTHRLEGRRQIPMERSFMSIDVIIPALYFSFKSTYNPYGKKKCTKIMILSFWVGDCLKF